MSFHSANPPPPPGRCATAGSWAAFAKASLRAAVRAGNAVRDAKARTQGVVRPTAAIAPPDSGHALGGGGVGVAREATRNRSPAIARIEVHPTRRSRLECGRAIVVRRGTRERARRGEQRVGVGIRAARHAKEPTVAWTVAGPAAVRYRANVSLSLRARAEAGLRGDSSDTLPALGRGIAPLSIRHRVGRELEAVPKAAGHERGAAAIRGLQRRHARASVSPRIRGGSELARGAHRRLKRSGAGQSEPLLLCIGSGAAHTEGRRRVRITAAQPLAAVGAHVVDQRHQRLALA